MAKRLSESEELARLRAFFRHWDQLMEYVGGSGRFVQPFTASELQEFTKLKKKYKYRPEFLLRL